MLPSASDRRQGDPPPLPPMEPTPSPIPAPRAPRIVTWLLALLLIWSFGLRIWYSSQELHSGEHFDERFTLRNVTAVLRDHTLQPRHAFYLSLSYLPQTALLAASEGLHRLTGIEALAIYGRTSDDYSPTAYLLCRGLNALFGTLSLLLIYKIGARLYSPWTGLLAAAILASFSRHLLSSAEIKPDILVILLVTLTFLWSLDAPGTQTLRPYLKAGLGVGLAVATKYTGIAAALPIAYIGLKEGWRERRRWLWLMLAGLTSIVVFVVLNPYLGMVFEFIPKLVRGYAVKGVQERSDHLTVVVRQVRFLIEHHGPVVAVFVGLGTLGLLWRAFRPAPDDPEPRRMGTQMVLSILLGYSVLHALGMTLFRGQNYLSVVPFSSLAAAWAMVELYRLAARRLPPLRSRTARIAAGSVAGLFLLARQSAVVYAHAVPSNWEVAEQRLLREIYPLDLRQVAHEEGDYPLQLQGRESRALTWMVDRLDRLDQIDPAQLDRLDVEVFPRSRLDGPRGAFYRSRVARPGASRLDVVGSGFLRSQGEEWILLHHHWQLASAAVSLPLRRGERPRQIEAPLPADLAPGAVLSLLAWVPRRDEGQIGAALLDPGARTVPLFDAGRKRRRYYLAAPRFVLAPGETQVRIVTPRRVESLDGYGMTLLRWSPGPGAAVAAPAAPADCQPAPAPAP